MRTRLKTAGLMVGVCIAIPWMVTGCERVSVSYHDYQPKHRHVWVSHYCADCGHDCHRCRGCDRYRHQTVHVRIESKHHHHWKARWCRDCDRNCRYCRGCDQFRHATVHLHIEKPKHHHVWVVKHCKKCKRSCRSCSGCKKVVHAHVGKGRARKKPRR